MRKREICCAELIAAILILEGTEKPLEVSEEIVMCRILMLVHG